MAPASRPPAASVYFAAGVAAGVACGLVHVVLPTALEAVGLGWVGGRASSGAAASTTARADTPAADADARAVGEAGQCPASHSDDGLVGTLTRWLVAKKRAAADALLGSSGGRKAGLASPAAAGLPAAANHHHPHHHPHHHHPSLVRAVHPPPSRLGRIAVGLPVSTSHGGPATPGSARAGTPVRVPESTDSEVVAALRAKLAGEDPPPATPPSARATEECVPANYTGARPPRYVSPRSASADGHAAGGAFA